MSKGNQTETDLLAKVLKATALPWDAIVNVFVALHTADPGEAGDQTTNEVAYTSYARVTVSRDGAGWTVAAGVGSNAALISFPKCTGGTTTATHVSIGTLVAGAGQILWSGALTTPLAISTNVTPQFAIGALTITED